MLTSTSVIPMVIVAMVIAYICDGGVFAAEEDDEGTGSALHGDTGPSAHEDTGPAVHDEIDPAVHGMAQTLLERYGYLPEPDTELGNLNTLIPLSELEDAITDFQHMANISQTGKLDNSTLEAFTWPRCANKDNPGDGGQRSGAGNLTGRAEEAAEGGNQDTEHRRRKRYVLEKPWMHTNINYKILNLTPDLSHDEQERAIEKAFQMWESASLLKFTKVTAAGQVADINFKFATGFHGDGFPFDGPRGSLAHAFYPPVGEVHFDEDETFTLGDRLGKDFYQIAAHELGHALGLRHSADPESVMWPYMSRYDPDWGLSVDDRRGISALYYTSQEKPRQAHVPDIPEYPDYPAIPHNPHIPDNPAIPVTRTPTEHNPRWVPFVPTDERPTPPRPSDTTSTRHDRYTTTTTTPDPFHGLVPFNPPVEPKTPTTTTAGPFSGWVPFNPPAEPSVTTTTTAPVDNDSPQHRRRSGHVPVTNNDVATPGGDLSTAVTPLTRIAAQTQTRPHIWTKIAATDPWWSVFVPPGTTHKPKPRLTTWLLLSRSTTARLTNTTAGHTTTSIFNNDKESTSRTTMKPGVQTTNYKGHTTTTRKHTTSGGKHPIASTTLLVLNPVTKTTTKSKFPIPQEPPFKTPRLEVGKALLPDADLVTKVTELPRRQVAEGEMEDDEGDEEGLEKSRKKNTKRWWGLG